jgi:flagellin
MSLVINTNTIANSVQRNLSANQANLSKSLARLSSGSKIVDPTDDAGGLAVSMKLSAAINRNVRAQQNVQNSISFLQTQDGAMSNVARILDRMSELKTMSLDVTKNSEDIANYDAEFTQLQGQLSNIKAEDFNGISLFNTTSNLTVYTTEKGDGSGQPSVTATRTGLFQDLGNTTIAGSAVATIVSDYNDQTLYTASLATTTEFVKSTNADGTISLAMIASTANDITAANHGFSYASELGDDLISISNVDKLYDYETGEVRARVFEAGVSTHAIGDVVFDDASGEFYLAAGSGGDYVTGVTNTAAAIDSNPGEFIKLGDFPSVSDYASFSTSEAYEAGDIVADGSNLYVATAGIQAGLALPNQGGSWTQLSAYNQSGGDLLTTGNTLSNYSVADFQTFLQTAATARAQNGAETARLQSSLDLLKTNQGNLTAARSVLADVDIASESTALARNNILVQSSAAMLAQANASQNVALSLLA